MTPTPKQLYLLDHAQVSWHNANIRDGNGILAINTAFGEFANRLPIPHDGANALFLQGMIAGAREVLTLLQDLSLEVPTPKPLTSDLPLLKTDIVDRPAIWNPKAK